jgi:colanic acid biosynthesis glycosyl transferase WcaI
MANNEYRTYEGRKKVCIISMTYWPIRPGQGTRVTKVYADLLREKFDLTIITSHVNNKKTKSFVVEYDQDGTKIVRIPSILFKNRAFFWRGLSIFFFTLSSMMASRHIDRNSIIFTIGPPEVPFFDIASRFIKPLRKTKHLGLVTDMIPDVAFDIGLVRSAKLRSIIRSYCAKAYRSVDHTVVITDYLKQKLVDYGVQATKITNVGLAVDTNTFNPFKSISDPNAIEIRRHEDRFIVLYSGSFGQMYNFNPLLEAAKSIQKINTKIRFVIRGDGDQRQQIAEKIKEFGLQNVTFLGPVPNTDQIISFINIASVCVIPIRDSRNIDMTYPSKLFEFWSCQRPVICSSKGETANLINRAKAGIAILPDDSTALTEAIMYLFNNPDLAKQMGINGRRLVEKEFSYRNVAERLTHVIQTMING